MSNAGDGPLVSPEWLAENLDRFESDDTDYRLFEVDIQEDAYASGHIPGATRIDWEADLRDTETFDVLSPDDFGDLLGGHGVTRETTVVLYGDFFNWFAAHAYWLLKYYRHENVLLLDGGRKYWLDNDFPMTTDQPEFSKQDYDAPSPDESVRARRTEVEQAIEDETCLLDVRAPAEFRGDILAPPGWNEGVQRGGHIPGAENMPCRLTIQADRRFRPTDKLADLFGQVGDADETIVYCRIGERSALVWFVLTELLGYENVSYYYGSFVEWGNAVGLPVESATSAELR